MTAVGIGPLAVDNQQQYRPRESPANRYIMDGAVDAGGISRGSSCKTSAIAFSAVQPHRLEVLKATSNAFVAEEQALGDVGPNGVLRAFKIASRLIELWPPGPLVADRGRISCLPPPSTDSFRGS
jgi:hypothetical protein